MFIYPIFISDDPDAEQVISSLPGQKRWGLNKLEGFLKPLVEKGLKGVILFGVPMKMEKVCLQYLVSTTFLTSRTPEALPQTIPKPPSSKLSTCYLNYSLNSCSPSMSVFVNTHPTGTVVSCRPSPTPVIPTNQHSMLSSRHLGLPKLL